MLRAVSINGQALNVTIMGDSYDNILFGYQVFEVWISARPSDNSASFIGELFF